MGTIGIVISSRCKKYINIYIYTSKGRKSKNRKKKVVATVGAVMAVKCPGLSRPLWPISHEQWGRISLQFPLPTAIHCFLFLCLSFYFFFKTTMEFLCIWRFHVSLGGTWQDFWIALVSTLLSKDLRHEILNVVRTKVTVFLSALPMWTWICFKLISFAKRPELLLVRIAPVWVCCFPTIFHIL